MSEITKHSIAALEPELQPVEVRSELGGLHAFWRFDNHYGASVINFGYGVELAVMHHDNITYDTPITGDVVGWISSPEELAGLLRQIRDLPTS